MPSLKALKQPYLGLAHKFSARRPPGEGEPAARRRRLRENQRRHRARVKAHTAELEAELAAERSQLAEARQVIAELRAEVERLRGGARDQQRQQQQQQPCCTAPQDDRQCAANSLLALSCPSPRPAAEAERIEPATTPLLHAGASDSVEDCPELPPADPDESTMLCREAFAILARNGWPGRDSDVVEERLGPGYRRARVPGDGCVVRTQVFFELVDYVTS